MWCASFGGWWGFQFAWMVGEDCVNEYRHRGGGRATSHESSRGRTTAQQATTAVVAVLLLGCARWQIPAYGPGSRYGHGVVRLVRAEPKKWIVDSSIAHHITGNEDYFRDSGLQAFTGYHGVWASLAFRNIEMRDSGWEVRHQGEPVAGFGRLRLDVLGRRENSSSVVGVVRGKEVKYSRSELFELALEIVLVRPGWEGGDRLSVTTLRRMGWELKDRKQRGLFLMHEEGEIIRDVYIQEEFGVFFIKGWANE